MTNVGTDADRPELIATNASSAQVTTPQEFFWTLGQDDPDPTAYYTPIAYIIDGSDSDALDKDALQRSMTTLVAAHGAYRTAIREVEGQLRQVVVPPEEAPPFQLEIVDGPVVPESEWKAHVAQIVAELVGRGFDLARGRVLWARLVELAPHRHALVTVFHHIAVDHGSFNLFFRRLWELYGAARKGESPSEQPEFQYIDVAAALARWALTPNGQAQAAAWRERLRDAPPVQLPIDLPREAADARRASARRGIVADPMYQAETCVLAGDVREAVTRAARRHRVSIFGVYLSGLYWLLHQETGQTDLCVESTVDMRAQNPAFAKVHGPLTGWTVLRADVSACKTFDDVIPVAGQAVAEVKKNGLIHDYYGVVPHTSRRVVLNYVFGRWAQTPAKQNEGLQMHRVGLPFPKWKRPWDLHLTLTDGFTANIAWTGNEKLFRKDTVHALLQRYLKILEIGTNDAKPTSG